MSTDSWVHREPEPIIFSFVHLDDEIISILLVVNIPSAKPICTFLRAELNDIRVDERRQGRHWLLWSIYLGHHESLSTRTLLQSWAVMLESSCCDFMIVLVKLLVHVEIESNVRGHVQELNVNYIAHAHKYVSRDYWDSQSCFIGIWRECVDRKKHFQDIKQKNMQAQKSLCSSNPNSKVFSIIFHWHDGRNLRSRCLIYARYFDLQTIRF